MSQFHDPRWDQQRHDPSHPYYQPQRRRMGPLLIVLLVLAVLGVLFVGAVVGMVVLVARMEAKVPAGYGDLEADQPAHVQDWASVREGYNPDAAEPGKQRLARLQRLLDEFVRCSNENDFAGMQKLVDYPRFLREMKQTRFAGDVRVYDRDDVMNSLVENLAGISGWNRMQIAGIQPLDQRGEMVVYGYGHHDIPHTNPVRFWVADGRTPKLYDWELLEYGNRETGKWAISLAYNTDPRLDAYRTGAQEIIDADQLWANGEVELAKEKLRDAESRRVPPPLRDTHLLEIAHTWLSWQRNDQAMELIARMQNKDAAPGAYFVEAQAMQARGELPQSLELLQKYEDIVGPTIAALRMKADVCRSLERWDEVEGHMRLLVKIAPDDLDIVSSWTMELHEDDLDQLAQHVAAMNDPIKAAAELAVQLSYRDHVEAVRVLANIVQQRSPDSVAATHLAALVHYAGDEFHEASPLFQKVYQNTSNEEARETVRYMYLQCMLDGERTLEAYQASDSPKEDFLYFAEGYEYGDSYLTEEQIKPLVEAHLQRVPDDPWGYYYASCIGEEDVEASEKLIRKGLTHAEDGSEDEENSVLDSLQSRLLHVMYQSGRAVEAYEEKSPSEETFRQLAGYFRYDEQRPVDELSALIAKHQAAHPDDKWIGFYSSIVQERNGNIERAIVLLQRSFKNLDPPEEDGGSSYGYYAEPHSDAALRNAIHDRWISLRLEEGSALSAYREVPFPEETFPILARRLFNTQDWQTLQQLTSLHRSKHAEDPQLLHWRAVLADEREEFALVASLLHPWPAEAEELEPWTQTTLREMQVKALIKTNQLAEARTAAERIRDINGGVLPLIKVEVSAGNVEQATRLIEQHLGASAYNSPYDDEDLVEALYDEPYAELRRRMPPRLGFGMYGQARSVLLTTTAPATTPEALRKTASAVLKGEVAVRAIADESTNSSSGQFIISGDGIRIVVAHGDGPYLEDTDLKEHDITDEDLLRRWNEHQGWISLHAIESDDEEDAVRMVNRLTAQLMDDQVAAVLCANWLLPGTKDIRTRLASGEAITADDNLGAEVWLYRAPPQAEDETQWQRQRPHRLRELDRAFADQTAQQQFHIQVTLRAGHAAEQHWLKLVSVRRSGRRDRSFFCEFTTDSLVRPRFTTGEYVHVMEYQVDNWKMTDGDQTTLARMQNDK